MDKEKYNERICRVIWHDALQNSIKPFSWSIDFRSIKVIDNGTEFMFQNHKKTGKVIIQYSERTGLFNVTVIHDYDERNLVIVEDVFLDMLVSVIDENLSSHEFVEHGVAV